MGNFHGVARRANLIGVGLPMDLGVRPTAMIDAFSKIWKDIRNIRAQDGGRRARFVINMSFEFQPGKGLVRRLARFLKKLAGNGDVVLVIASGNCRVDDPDYSCDVSIRLFLKNCVQSHE